MFDLCENVTAAWGRTCGSGSLTHVRGRDYVLQKLLLHTPEELLAIGLVLDE
jgi:hypothetical protein